jgi:peptidoglycan/xylan/chitin deacetylase (PgdA/CDA1 family)
MERANDQAMRCDIQIIKKFFPEILFYSDDESIHLTFDDGPHPIATPFILQELKRRGIKATFFLLGQNVQKFPDLVRQIHEDGHQIGNHSLSHTNLLLKSKKCVQAEILGASTILQKTIGAHSSFFRPPYGYFDWRTMNVLRFLGMTCVLWNVDSKDYKLKSAVDISRRVIMKTGKGSILLFHDNDLTSHKIQTYLPAFLDASLHNRFIFKTLSI